MKDRAHVVLMCGVAGSGKTTYARTLELQGYVRLSIDEEMWLRYGCDPDLSITEREAEYAIVEGELRDRLIALCANGSRVVIDFSFWSRTRRDQYKELVESLGATWELIYLDVPHEEIRGRISRRNQTPGPNSVHVDDATLDRYLSGFENPQGEGETVISVDGSVQQRQ